VKALGPGESREERGVGGEDLEGFEESQLATTPRWVWPGPGVVSHGQSRAAGQKLFLSFSFATAVSKGCW
jgi:hypothetical protein